MNRMARPPKKSQQDGPKPSYRKHKGRLIRVRLKQLEGIELIAYRDGTDVTEVANSLLRDSLVRLGLFPPETMTEEWAAIKKRMEETQGKG